MFGRQNDNQQDNGMGIPPQAIDGALSAEPETPAPETPKPQAWQHPGMPLDAPVPDADSPSDEAKTPSDPMIISGNGTPNMSFPSAPANDVPTAHQTNEHSDSLLDIKREALGQLSPLVGHLDQTPEERFRTMMMMIQASDDQSLIKDAYAAAQAIEDEGARAQALLDVINEINYFTQPKPEA